LLELPFYDILAAARVCALCSHEASTPAQLFRMLSSAA
jgi:hypothetical protein